MFEAFKNFIRRVRGLATNSFLRSVEDIAKAQNVNIDTMMDNINLWLNMYSGNAPWLHEDDKSLQLPSIIASEMARMVTLEMAVSITGSPMADFISEQIKPVLQGIRLTTEYACAGGGVFFKPCVTGDKQITVETILANSCYPRAFNTNLQITAASFVYRRWEGKKVYTRIESHDWDGRTLTIRNTAYVSSFDDALGTECALTEVSEWAEIDPVVEIQNVTSPLYAYFKIPIGNTVDMDSPLGVSIYSRAVDTIRDADEQYQRLMWEYEGGELAIDAAEDAFDSGSGEPQLPKGKERLFRMNYMDAAKNSDTLLFKEWAPSLRDSNYISGLNRVLMQIENQCSLSRGTLSDAQDVAKTATEIKISKYRIYDTVSDIQSSLERALNELIEAIHTLAVLYDMAPDGKYEATYTWDDSVLVDAETERMRDQQEVTQGLMMKYEYRMKWYGESEEEAKRKLGDTEDFSDDDLLSFQNEPPAGVNTSEE